MKTWVIAFDRRQRESTCNAMEEKELIEDERECVDEVVVYDEVMEIECNHQVSYRFNESFTKLFYHSITPPLHHSITPSLHHS